MRAIIFTSLLLVLISLAGCQSNSVSYQVESKIGPLTDTNQRLVNIKAIEVSRRGNKTVANSTYFAVQGQEGRMSVKMPRGIKFDSKFLVDQAKSFVSVTLSKKGRVFWSSEQTTELNDEG